MARCGDDSQRVCLGRNAQRFQASPPGTLEVPAHWRWERSRCARPGGSNSSSRFGPPLTGRSSRTSPYAGPVPAAMGSEKYPGPAMSARLRDLRSCGAAPPNSHIRFSSHSYSHVSSGVTHSHSHFSSYSESYSDSDSYSESDSDSESHSDSDSDSDGASSSVSTSSSVQEVSAAGSSVPPYQMGRGRVVLIPCYQNCCCFCSTYNYSITKEKIVTLSMIVCHCIQPLDSTLANSGKSGKLGSFFQVSPGSRPFFQGA